MQTVRKVFNQRNKFCILDGKLILVLVLQMQTLPDLFWFWRHKNLWLVLCCLNVAGVAAAAPVHRSLNISSCRLGWEQFPTFILKCLKRELLDLTHVVVVTFFLYTHSSLRSTWMKRESSHSAENWVFTQKVVNCIHLSSVKSFYFF